jgi:multidrug resistance efflux pump
MPPKVPGYITAVPVTDNEHVAAGQRIAWINDHDYFNALASQPKWATVNKCTCVATGMCCLAPF